MYNAKSLKELRRCSRLKALRAAGFLESRVSRIAEVEDRVRVADGRGVAVEGI